MNGNSLVVSDIEMNSLLQHDIVKRFGVSPEFLLEYQDQFPAFDWSKNSWDEFLESLTPLNQLHTSFAMSTVQRGRYACSLLDQNGSIKARNRYLDIGTAYAGFLRAFKERGFRDVIGIELQERLARLGTANIRGLCGAQVIVGDFLRDDYSSLGAFDIVTCNDVIEHVDDAVFAIKKMSNLVAAAGCLALEVPNKNCISFVKSDGHFQIFGITQLLRDGAADYYAAIMSQSDEGRPDPALRENKRGTYLFEMGEMYELEWYIKHLSEHGMKVSVADTHKIAKLRQAPNMIDELKHAYTEWAFKTAPNIEKNIADAVIEAVDAYLRRLESDFAELNDEASQKRFEDKYLRSFWTLLAVKDEAVVATNQNRMNRPLGLVGRFLRFLSKRAA